MISISEGEKKTIQAILDFTRRNRFQPSPSELAQSLGEKTPAIIKRLAALEKNGWIEVIYDKGGRVRAYDILWLP